MNATSSRAHTVVTIVFDQISKNQTGQETKKSSNINLVDLAGLYQKTKLSNHFLFPKYFVIDETTRVLCHLILLDW